MNPYDFVNSVFKLENKEYETIKDRFNDDQVVRLTHAGIGLCTEVGEFQDLLKKKLIYGKEIDNTKLVDELGDIMWYIGLACNTLNISLEDVMNKNYKKLSVRYGEKFNETSALVKNKEVEWKVQNEND